MTTTAKKVDDIIVREKDKRSKEVEMIIKDIKLNTKLSNQKQEKREEMRKKAKEREEKAAINRKRVEEQEREKKNQYKEKLRKKEMQKIHKQLYEMPYYQNHKEEVDAIAEKDRLQYKNDVNSKIKIYSVNRREHLENVRQKFYEQNEGVRVKHDTFMTEAMKGNDHIRLEIDANHAKKFDQHNKYLMEKQEEIDNYFDKLHEREEMAKRRKYGYTQEVENKIEEVARMVKKGENIYQEQDSKEHKEQKDYDTLAATKENNRKREEKLKELEQFKAEKEKEFETETEKILRKEYEKFAKAGKLELDVQKRQTNHQLRTVQLDMDLDEKVHEMWRELAGIKPPQNVNQP